eukprot:scaffold3341_cov317-Prasinococcus_capsulatus_cf.AAC.2
MQQVGERRQADRLGGDRVALRALVLSACARALRLRRALARCFVGRAASSTAAPAVREPGAPVEGAAPDPQKGGPADGDAPRLVEPATAAAATSTALDAPPCRRHPRSSSSSSSSSNPTAATTRGEEAVSGSADGVREGAARAGDAHRLALAGGAVVDGGAGERAARVLVVVAGREDEVDAEQARGLVAHAARVLRGVLEGVEVLRREEVVQQPVAAPPLRRLLARHGLVGLRDDPEGALVHLDAVLPCACARARALAAQSAARCAFARRRRRRTLLVDGAERVQVLAHLLKVLRPRRARLAEQRAVLALGRQRLRKLRAPPLVRVSRGRTRRPARSCGAHAPPRRCPDRGRT